MNYKKDEVTNLLNTKCMNVFGCSIDDATEKQADKTLCYVVKDLLAEKRSKFAKQYKEKEGKQVYYMSMEFLVGTSLRNNLYNLGMESVFKSALKQKNQLGMMMGFGCVMVLAIQFLLSLLANIGVSRFGQGAWCLFFGYGRSGQMVSAVLMGILLSIYRHQNVTPELVVEKRAVAS